MQISLLKGESVILKIGSIIVPIDQHNLLDSRLQLER